jgi:maltooligosyltrehalose trehalohydrolase
MTGRNEAYYMDYRGTPQEFVSAAKRGFLYQGQRYGWQKGRRGCPSLDLPPAAFITYIQNHDQVANSLWGRRIHSVASGGIFRAMTALFLLGPGTPMLFQGQEFAASSPFLYFADHNPELAKLVAKGRAEFLSQFPSIASTGAAELLADPELEETFTRCKLDFADRERNQSTYDLHRDLLRLRKDDPLLGKLTSGDFDGAVLGPASFCLRFFGREQNDRLLVVNLGPGQRLEPVPEPLLAPPDGHKWALRWSSEDPRYGGDGAPPLQSEDESWSLPACCTTLLVPTPDTNEPDSKH